MATARGWHLDRWRYGRDLDEQVARTVEREQWTAARWNEWREDSLVRLLHHAATTVPWYRDHWAARRRGGERGSWEELERWPVLPKSAVRISPRAFLSDRPRSRKLFEDHTSGTTGTPLSVWLDRPGVRAWYALFEARVRRWNGVHRRDRWAVIGGQPVVPVGRSDPPYWVWNAASRQLYLSALHIRAATAPAYVRAMRNHRVRWFLGYPSAIASLARAAEEAGVLPPPLEVVVTNAEPLVPRQEALIERVFTCPVRDTYGMAEAVAGASACSSGALHLWPDAGVIEVVQGAEAAPAPGGSTGRFLCTGLVNWAMPLVRYDVGDRGRLVDGSACNCGRLLPTLGAVEGRDDDMVVTRDGRFIGRLDPVFKSDLPVIEAQIVQHDLDRFEIALVPDRAFDDDCAEVLRARLREHVGDVTVEIRTMDAIPRGANGKFRAVISEVTGST
jgi:phenylacetate-CoA ligase